MSDVVDSLPLFIFTLFGGLAVRRTLDTIGWADVVDPSCLQSVVGRFMDYLVVAAVATLNVLAIAQSAAPLFVLIVAGLIWSAFCLFFVGRWLLPSRYWFQLGLLNYGMSTGTTATGFVLLKLVDPKLKSGAAEDYALASPLSAPFIGGGALTLAMPLVFLERSPSLAPVCLVLWSVLVVLLGVGWFLKTD